MAFLSNYGLFLAKTLTLVIAILIVAVGIFAIGKRGDDDDDESLKIRRLNDRYEGMRTALASSVMPKKAFKKMRKSNRKEKKAAEKEKEKTEVEKTRIFVLDFKGDIRASAVDNLRDEVTAVITGIKDGDKVFLRLESPGGQVHSYGLAASQLARLRTRDIPLIVAVDKIAASGGYLMASVADTIVAAPFSIIGSIGVIAQLPNFNRLLKKQNIDFEQFTAGEYKRSVTMFGENTDKDRAKLREDLEETHELFKDYIRQHRPNLDVAEVATGEHWYGSQALDLGLIDDVRTSDDWLLEASETTELFEISATRKRSLKDRIFRMAHMLADYRKSGVTESAAENRYFLS